MKLPRFTTKEAIGQIKFRGPEPDFRGKTPTLRQLSDAWGWYSVFYDWADVKTFTMQYLLAKNVKKDILMLIDKADGWDLKSYTGWNCRMLLRGAILPKECMDKLWADVALVARKMKAKVEEPKVVVFRPKADRIHGYLEFLEGKLDDFITKGESFDFVAWMKEKAISSDHAERISEKYKPVYREIFEALNGKDPDLKFAYAHVSKEKMQATLNFLRAYVGASAILKVIPKKPRKPRKKKIKSAAVQVVKLTYQKNDPKLKLNSISPESIIKANQLWTFNTKYRTLTVLRAANKTGLSVKGSTVYGWDEKNSETRMLKKPELTLPQVLQAGKVQLRHVMESVKSKNRPVTGRIGKDTILLRAVT